MQEDIDEINIIEQWLTDKKTSKVHIRVPRRGEKHHLVEMVAQNALQALTQFKDKLAGESLLAKEGPESLSSLLGLNGPPHRIEAYDISNTGSSEIVASMVVFENGSSNNREYRRFKIKTVDTQNDYASMQEVIFRRFKHAEKEINEMEAAGLVLADEGKFTRLPDLILVDGGLGHVNAAKSVLNNLNIGIPVYGMVKDDNHRTRGIIGPEGEYDLTGNLIILRFITAIQDEAHRFAVDYNKKLRKKRYSGSVLDEIEGVGPKRKKALIKHFGSVKRIKDAEVDDLLAIEGINKDTAERIYNYFR